MKPVRALLKVSVVTCLSLALLPTAAFADKGGHGNGKGKGQDKKHDRDRDDDRDRDKDRDRDNDRDHDRDDHDRDKHDRDRDRGSLLGTNTSHPPGWSKGKKTGWGNCDVPPGQVKKYGCHPNSTLLEQARRERDRIYRNRTTRATTTRRNWPTGTTAAVNNGTTTTTTTTTRTVRPNRPARDNSGAQTDAERARENPR